MDKAATKANLIQAHFKIATPLFLGGAAQEADGIRPPSIKGALRFWWRALNWGRFLQAAQGNEVAALKALHAMEADLFGLAGSFVDGKPRGGQGKFLLKVIPGISKLKTSAKGSVHYQFRCYDAARYLGYGLMEAFSSQNKGTQAGQLLRDCIDDNQTFDLHLIFRKELDASILDAVVAMGLLGGLGSRARHGMGSVSLMSMYHGEKPVWTAPATKQAYVEAIQGLLSKYALCADKPPFSAFSRNSRVDALLEESSPYVVLNNIGNAELMYRSWGKGKWVLGQQSEERFDKDHDWSHSTRPANFHPRRVVFGLPHNYGKPAYQHVTPKTFDRRASPLLFHVHALGEASFVGVSILLPATFLPQNEKINAGGSFIEQKIEWDILKDFLDGNIGKPSAPTDIHRFPDRMAVLP